MKGGRAARRYLAEAGFFGILIPLTTLLSLPSLVAVFTSFKPYGEIFSRTPAILPHRFTLASYEKLFAIPEFAGYMANSLVVAGATAATAAAAVAAGVMAAYALTFLRFRGRSIVAQALLTTYMFPAITLVSPLFFLATRFDLLDTYGILVLTNLSFALPIAVWLLLGFFESIPPELEKAARADGCSRLQAVVHVILPIMAPAIIAVGAFAFILSWGEYLFAMTLSLTDAHRTASAGMHALMGNYRIDYGLLTAAATLMVAPVVVLFLIFQRHIVDGLTSASVK